MTIIRPKKFNSSVRLKTGASFVKVRPLFSYDAKYIFLAAGIDVKVLSTASGECITRLVGHHSAVVGLQKNPLNHTQLISCSRDGTIITWDYLDGVHLKKFKIKGGGLINAFFAPSKSSRVFIIQYEKERDGHVLKSVYLKQHTLTARFVLKDVLPSEHAVSFGVQGQLVTSIQDKKLVVFNLAKGITNRHMSQSRFVCVTCHPYEFVVATGDETGRILVWSNVFDHSTLCRSVYHWHTLPVADLCFSSEGSYLYSGGGECVLVKWNLRRENREYLPRLGLPICHVMTSAKNDFIAVCHVDNAVSLVSSQLKVVQYIQGLSHANPWSCPGQQIVPTGLLHDPRTGALVLSGRPGHLQFYSLKNDKQLYSVDVTGQNFITQERNLVIYNTQVEKAAIDPSGLWMSTVQIYDDGQSSPDIVLKVWKYRESCQTYSLNTTVILPHYKGITCVKFRPKHGDDPLLFVTTSLDLCFKTWVLHTSTEGSDTIESWACESRGHYRNQIPTDTSFQQNGSTFAVAFGCTVTLWDPSPLVLLFTLSQQSCSVLIRQVDFGRDECCDLLVCRSDVGLTVWNTSQRNVSWKAVLKTTHMTADPQSEFFATFSQDHTLFVFKPSSSTPCFILENVSTTEVFSSAFIPNTKEESKEELELWCRKSQLYFMNKNQELLTLVDNKNDSGSDENGASAYEVEEEKSGDWRQVSVHSHFAALVAENTNRDMSTSGNLMHHTTSGLLGSKEVQELLEIPSYGLPSVRSLCSQFINALLIPKSNHVL